MQNDDFGSMVGRVVLYAAFPILHSYLLMKSLGLEI
jgi:hypothetical protein